MQTNWRRQLDNNLVEEFLMELRRIADTVQGSARMELDDLERAMREKLGRGRQWQNPRR